MSTVIDPRVHWLSDRIVLADLMGCDSVYRYGLQNQITDSDADKLKEGRHLVETLEGYTQSWPLSVTYGYISPGLSRSIVRYQDPNRPSYHRWDYGAAMDLVLFRKQEPAYTVSEDDRWYYQSEEPLETLGEMYSEGTRWSRAITYAESQIFCFGTRRSERPDKERMATYENRYMGPGNRPKHIKIPATRLMNHINKSANVDWRGKGWPSHHGGGRRQYEHVPVGSCNVLSDFLYDALCVNKGIPNRPPVGKPGERMMRNVMAAAMFYERIVMNTGRLPIIAAYVNPASRHCRIDRSFNDYFVIDIAVPPSNLVVDTASASTRPGGEDIDVVLAFADERLIVDYSVNRQLGVVRFFGREIDEMEYDTRELIDFRYCAEKRIFHEGIHGSKKREN